MGPEIGPQIENTTRRRRQIQLQKCHCDCFCDCFCDSRAHEPVDISHWNELWSSSMSSARHHLHTLRIFEIFFEFEGPSTHRSNAIAINLKSSTRFRSSSRSSSAISSVETVKVHDSTVFIKIITFVRPDWCDDGLMKRWWDWTWFLLVLCGPMCVHDAKDESTDTWKTSVWKTKPASRRRLENPNGIWMPFGKPKRALLERLRTTRPGWMKPACLKALSYEDHRLREFLLYDFAFCRATTTTKTTILLVFASLPSLYAWGT